MFLLIRGCPRLQVYKICYLHSTMFLLILKEQSGHDCFETDLHSTMFLLILFSAGSEHHGEKLFTFHNVSINSCFY